MRLLLLSLLATAAVGSEPAITPPVDVAESVVEAAVRPDWPRKTLAEGTGAIADDAMLMLAVLGAGYDHKTPNRYKKPLALGVQRISGLDPGSLDLPVLALSATVLAEAYAMTADPGVRPQAETFLGNLRRRWPNELPRWLGRSGIFAGPESATMIVRALRSAQAGGLEVGNDLQALRSIDLGQGEASELARACIACLCGDKPPLVDLATAQRWSTAFDRWWKEGQCERIEMALWVASRNGGAEWRLFQVDWRDRLIALQIRSGPEEGQWPLAHHPLGKMYGTAQAMRCLEVFYRYAQANPAPEAK
jgi:hypothetical protein